MKFYTRISKGAAYYIILTGGVNYTLTASEMVGQRVEKLANKTLMVTTTTVSFIIMNTLYLKGILWGMVWYGHNLELF